MRDEVLCGCEILTSVIGRCGFHSVFAVPGKPATHLCDCLAKTQRGFEWAQNEKLALETSVGLSVAGRRSAVVMKHNGMNLALDPLINAAYHGIGSGLLVFVGDDVDAAASTCSQDSRSLGRIANVPVVELTSATQLGRVLEASLELSEMARTPVLMRFTEDLHSLLRLARIQLEEVETPPSLGTGFDPAVAHDLTKLGRQQWRRLQTWPAVEALVGPLSVESEHHLGDCRQGILTVGSVGLKVTHEACSLNIGVSWPFPDQAREFANDHDIVVVGEEPWPIIEELLRSDGHSGHIRGRLSGHLPPEGHLRNGDLVRGLDNDPRDWTEIQRKGPPEAVPHSFDSVLAAVAALRRSGCFVATDVGSSVKLCYPPYSGADVALCLGSAIGVASGAARSGKRAIAVIGDYGLLHSGLGALFDIARLGLPVLTVVLANGISHQTGGQPTYLAGDNPGSLKLRPLLAAVEGLPVADWAASDLSADDMRRRFQAMLDSEVPSVVLVSDGVGVA
jgi:indolepyruvate ferredoxin oxidoreductase alpha subunit